jgi:hypothetical protein
MYAKIALSMFYPFQCLDDLTIEGSYWENSLNNYNIILKTKKLNFGEGDLKYYRI